MPITATYPGVYIEELPSGQPTVTAVATNIAAFIGRAPIGTVDEPVTIFNYGDYTRLFGGLASDYPMSYAVQDFFQNGGSQAVIARLFQPIAGEGDGYARLPFPVSPPELPEGWRLSKAANVGDTVLTVSMPTGGSEGAPDLGMQFTVNNDPTQLYTVIGFKPADTSKGTPATISIFPALGGRPGQLFSICSPLNFQYGPSPGGWVILSNTPSSITLYQGAGIPELGDTFTVAGDNTVYTITDQPTVSVMPGGSMQIQAPFTPKPAKPFLGNTPVTIAPPSPSPMPVGWQIDAMTPGASGKPSTLAVVNGTGNPLPNDLFTVGSKPDVYVVTAFTPATAKAMAQISFVPESGALPADPSAFCFCCTLEFTRPAPLNYAVGKGPKIGETKFTLSNNNGAATGVVDVGDTFQVQGDQTVYTVRLFDRASNTVSFLPEAESAFDGTNQITFSPPLVLKAANPGAWGNLLTAEVDNSGITDQTAAQFASYGLGAEDLFNLKLRLLNAQGRVVATETYLNLSVKSTGAAASFPNRLDRVLSSQSALASVDVLPMVPPASGAAAKGSGGTDSDYLSPLTYIGDPDLRTGMYMLEHTLLFNLLCIPPDRRILPEVPLSMQDLDPAVRAAAAEYATDRRAIYIVDPPAIWTTQVRQGEVDDLDPSQLGITGTNKDGIEVARNAAVYFPRIVKEDLLMKSQPAVFAPCGAIAGIIAATDVARGVWKAPAGTDAGIGGILKLETNLNDSQNGVLNPLGINCLRNFPIIGPVVWGARTLRGADQFEDDYKYLPVRRLTLFIEDSLFQATQWAVFEPNDEALWSSLRLMVTNFLAALAQQGALYDYAVKCDATTTSQSDIDNGVVNILVQIAPVKPAEFVVIQIQQTAGQSPS